jgi:hypothetical protein
MSDLRAELDAALQAITPGDVPVEAAMRQGRRLRLRRRLAAAAGVAAVAVFAAAGYPALTRQLGGVAAPPAQHPRVIVTDIPPALGTPDNGLIAQGTIGSQRWQVSLDSTSGPQCISARVGVGSLTGGCYQPGAFNPAKNPPPLFLQGDSDGTYTVAVGGVRANVTYYTATLTDGQQLNLIPVTSHGRRYVAYALPDSLRIASVTAYLADGGKLTSVPFNRPGYAISEFARWAPPGQPEPAKATALIGSGTVNARPWSVTAYAGPWGTCLVWTSGEALCLEFTRMPGTSVIGSVGSARQAYVAGVAAAGVSQVAVTLADGTSFTVPARAVGGQKLWAFALATGQRVQHWTAYDAAGHQVASGAMPAR